MEEENLKEYSVLDTEEMIYKSRDWGNPDYPDVLNSLQKDCQAAETVKLRVGAQVMLVKNVSLEEKLFNGARGMCVVCCVVYASMCAHVSACAYVNT